MELRRYPISSLWQEMEDMRSELENVLRQRTESGRLLPAGGVTDRMLPAIMGEFRVDVFEQGEEVIIVADLPGVEREDVAIELVNPRTLEITCEIKKPDREGTARYLIRERLEGSMRRHVTLPTYVTEEGAKASFRNGILEIRLRKTRIATKSQITIE